jgi:hypothetical protein
MPAIEEFHLCREGVDGVKVSYAPGNVEALRPALLRHVIAMTELVVRLRIASGDGMCPYRIVDDSEAKRVRTHQQGGAQRIFCRGVATSAEEAIHV